MNPFLIEPYHPFGKGIKKKHWMEIAEEEALFFKNVHESLTVNQQVQSSTAASVGVGAGGTPSYSYFLSQSLSVAMVHAFWQGASIGNLSITFPEPSGLAWPRNAANVGYIWMEQDSGGPNTFLAINTTTLASGGSWTLEGVTQVDFEDCTSFTKNGVNYLVMGDTGDNASARASIVLYRCVEPTINGSNGTILSGSIEAITCTYPVGNAPALKDCECIFADPDTGDIYLVTKRIFPALVYKLPYATSYVGSQILTFVCKLATDTSATSVAIGTGTKTFTTVSGLGFSPGMLLRVASRANSANFMEGEVISNSGNTLVLFVDVAGTNPTTGGAGTLSDWDITLPTSDTPTGNNGCVTAGAITRNGKEICLVNYNNSYLWLRDTGLTISESLARAPIPLTGDVVGGKFYSHDIPSFPQREGVEFSDSGDLYSIGEYNVGSGITNPFIKSIRAASSASTLRLQNGLNSYTGCLDTYIGNLFATSNASLSASLIADIDFAVATTFSSVATATAGTMIDVTCPASTTFVVGAGALIATSSVASYLGTWEVDSKPNGTVVRLKCPFNGTANGSIQAHTQDRVTLLKFSDLSLIPSTATIIDAKLRIYINTEGKGFQINRMKTSWTDSSTWTSLSNGVFPSDGTKAEPVKDAYVPTSILDTYTGYFTVNIPTTTVQGWINGTITNNGWAILGDELDLTGDGLQLDSVESVTQTRKPMLIVSYY
jgi:hypothetical protein